MGIFDENEKNLVKFMAGETIPINNRAIMHELKQMNAHFGCSRKNFEVEIDNFNQPPFVFVEFEGRCRLYPHCSTWCRDIVASKKALKIPCVL